MKILFLITGIGYGHALREYTIIKEILKKHPKTQIKVITYGTSWPFFKNKYPTIKIRGAKLPDYEFNYKVRSIIKANLFYPFKYITNIIRVKKIIKEFRPDLVITDFEPAGIMASRKTNTRFITIFNFNPNLLQQYAKENKITYSIKLQAAYVNHYYKLSKKVVIPTLFGPHKKVNHFVYTNPIARQSPREFDEEKLMKKLGLKKRPILIAIGGSNFGIGLVESMINILPQFKEEFIIFGYPYSKEKISKNIATFTFKPNFLEYLSVCKGIITLAGHNTLSELLVYKKPALIFPVKNHIEQMLNAYEIKKRKYGIVKNLDSLNPEMLKEYIKGFIKDIPILQKKLNRLDLNGTGAKEIVRIIDEFK